MVARLGKTDSARKDIDSLFEKNFWIIWLKHSFKQTQIYVYSSLGLSPENYLSVWNAKFFGWFDGVGIKETLEKMWKNPVLRPVKALQGAVHKITPTKIKNAKANAIAAMKSDESRR